MDSEFKTPTVSIENLPKMPPKESFEEFQRQQYLSKLKTQFEEQCPFEYKNTDVNHADFPKGPNFERIMAYKWSKGAKGLMVGGKTGVGKTRSIWLLIHKLMTKDGVRVRAISDPTFSREYSKRLGNGTADEWMEGLSKVPILFIDDFGKSAVTPRYREQFYDILESRTNSGNPIIVTTQLDRAAIMTRFGDEDGEALVRRLLEFMDIVRL